MNTEAEMLAPGTAQAAAPSVDFIHAISEFLDTNPDDLLVELGYYSRETGDVPPAASFAQD